MVYCEDALRFQAIHTDAAYDAAGASFLTNRTGAKRGLHQPIHLYIYRIKRHLAIVYRFPQEP
jgi:hypothetical protein